MYTCMYNMFTCVNIQEIYINIHLNCIRNTRCIMYGTISIMLYASRNRSQFTHLEINWRNLLEPICSMKKSDQLLSKNKDRLCRDLREVICQ